MPIREYVCRHCGARVERLERREGMKPPRACCFNSAMRKVASAPAPAQFKGPGFYATEYRDSPKRDE